MDPTPSSASLVSATVAEHPAAQLAFATEAASYVTRVLDGQRSERDRQLAQRFAAALRLDSATRTISAIPCFVLEGGLGRALEAYTTGGAALARHHIVVFLNAGPKVAPVVYREALAARLEEIESVQRRSPELRVTALEHHFAMPVQLGQVRGLMADGIVGGACAAGLADPILVSNDADQWQVAHDYLTRIVAAYDAQPALDVTAGPILWGGYEADGRPAPGWSSGSAIFPEIYLGDLFVQASDAVYRRGEGGVTPLFQTAGPNSSIRLASLCAIGGYDFTLGDLVGEEVDLGIRARKMRRVTHSADAVAAGYQAFLEGNFVVTDPRRSFHAVLTERVVAEQWSDFATQLGADLQTAELAEAYRRKLTLIQEGDLLRASAGEPDALHKLRERIRQIVLGSARNDRITREPHLHAVAARLGLRVASAQWSEGRLADVALEWEASTLPDVLCTWAKRWGGAPPT